MTTKSTRSRPVASPTLEQIVKILRKLSGSELETLEILLDKEATMTIRESMKEATEGKLKRPA